MVEDGGNRLPSIHGSWSWPCQFYPLAGANDCRAAWKFGFASTHLPPNPVILESGGIFGVPKEYQNKTYYTRREQGP